MYDQRGSSAKLDRLLAKVRGTEHPTPAYTPVTYTSSEIRSARTVLDRLLATSSRNELSSINIVPKELEEV